MSRTADFLVLARDWLLAVQAAQMPKEVESKTRQRLRLLGHKLVIPLGFPNPLVREAFMSPLVDTSLEPFVMGSPDWDAIGLLLAQKVTALRSYLHLVSLLHCTAWLGAVAHRSILGSAQGTVDCFYTTAHH